MPSRAHQSSEQKMRAIGMLQGGMSSEDVATKLQVAKRTVQRWKARFVAENNVHRRVGVVRKRASTEEQTQKLIDFVRENPFSTTEEAKTATEFPGSLSTCRRRVQEAELHTSSPTTKSREDTSKLQCNLEHDAVKTELDE